MTFRMNMEGDVTVADDSVNNKTVVTIPALAGGSIEPSIVVIGFSSDYSLPGSPVSSYSQAFPFDTEVLNTDTSAFTVEWTYDVGIKMNVDGWYRLGLSGKFQFTFDVTGGAGSPSTAAVENGEHDLTILSDQANISYPIKWSRIGNGSSWSSVYDPSFDESVNIVTSPIFFNANEHAEASLNVTDGFTISSMTLYGENQLVSGHKEPFRFWIEKLQ
jgi:hypothetical protein